MATNRRLPNFTNMPHITYKDMRAALEVSEQGSITKAAINLGMSQPGLTRMVQRLERNLGFKLFTRKSKKESMKVTEQGQFALIHMDRAIRDIYRLITEEPV